MPFDRADFYNRYDAMSSGSYRSYADEVRERWLSARDKYFEEMRKYKPSFDFQIEKNYQLFLDKALELPEKTSTDMTLEEFTELFDKRNLEAFEKRLGRTFPYQRARYIMDSKTYYWMFLDNITNYFIQELKLYAIKDYVYKNKKVEMIRWSKNITAFNESVIQTMRGKFEENIENFILQLNIEDNREIYPTVGTFRQYLIERFDLEVLKIEKSTSSYDLREDSYKLFENNQKIEYKLRRCLAEKSDIEKYAEQDCRSFKSTKVSGENGLSDMLQKVVFCYTIVGDQDKKELIKWIECFIKHGYSPFDWLDSPNDKERTMVDKLDWQALSVCLSYIQTYTKLSNALRYRLIRYCKDNIALDNGWFFKHFVDYNIKTARHHDVIVLISELTRTDIDPEAVDNHLLTVCGNISKNAERLSSSSLYGSMSELQTRHQDLAYLSPAKSDIAMKDQNNANTPNMNEVSEDEADPTDVYDYN